jgi:hypothetical protein
VLRVIGTWIPSSSSSSIAAAAQAQLLLQGHRVLAGTLLWLFKLVRGVDEQLWGRLAGVLPAVQGAAADDDMDTGKTTGRCSHTAGGTPVARMRNARP